MNRLITNRIHLFGFVGALLTAALFSSNLLAQCSGSIGASTDPNTAIQPLEFTGYPEFAEIVRITLEPTPGSGSLPLTVDAIDVGLACAENGDDVPCQFGNDVGESSGEVPIEFVGAAAVDAGTACADLGDIIVTEDPDGNAGTVRFEFPALTLAEGDSCRLAYDVRVRDRGTDNTPLTLTGAAASEGVCGSLNGSAQGSYAIQLIDAPPPPPPPPLSVPGPQGWWLVLMALVMLVPAATRFGRI